MEEWSEYEQISKGKKRRAGVKQGITGNVANSFPSLDTVIIEVAATINPHKRRIGYGIIARSCCGNVKAVWALMDTKISVKSATEAEVIRFAVIRARKEGYSSRQLQYHC